MEFAPISRNYKIPIYKQDSKKNWKYINKFKSLIEFFGNKDAKVLEYWLDNSYFSKYIDFRRVKLPFQQTIMKKDIEFYKSNGIDFITSFAAFLDEKYYKKYGNPPIKQFGKILME